MKILGSIILFLFHLSSAYSQSKTQLQSLLHQLFFNVPVDLEMSELENFIKKDSILLKKFIKEQVEDSTDYYYVVYSFDKHPIIKNNDNDNHFWIDLNSKSGYVANLDVSFKDAYKQGLEEYKKMAYLLKKSYKRIGKYKFYRAFGAQGNVEIYKVKGLNERITN